MQQQISVITLGVEDLARSRRFYERGFEWTSIFDILALPQNPNFFMSYEAEIV